MVLGLLVTALLGHPNSITVPVTAVLVVGTGQGTSAHGVRLYAAKRVLIQVVGAVLFLPPLTFLQRRFTFQPWLTVLLACLLPLAVFFYLDYRFHLSPMYITSACVSGLILVTGTEQSADYPFTRILLVVAGGLLGYLLSVVLLPRDHGRDALCCTAQALGLLRGGVEAALAGGQDTLGARMARCDQLLPAGRLSLAALPEGQDRRWEEECLDRVGALRLLLGLWQARYSGGSEVPEHARDWLGRLPPLLYRCDRLLSQGEDHELLLREKEAEHALLLDLLAHGPGAGRDWSAPGSPVL